jgi:hypothetical protein
MKKLALLACLIAAAFVPLAALLAAPEAYPEPADAAERLESWLPENEDAGLLAEALAELPRTAPSGVTAAAWLVRRFACDARCLARGLAPETALITYLAREEAGTAAPRDWVHLQALAGLVADDSPGIRPRDAAVLRGYAATVTLFSLGLPLADELFAAGFHAPGAQRAGYFEAALALNCLDSEALSALAATAVRPTSALAAHCYESARAVHTLQVQDADWRPLEALRFDRYATAIASPPAFLVTLPPGIVREVLRAVLRTDRTTALAWARSSAPASVGAAAFLAENGADLPSFLGWLATALAADRPPAGQVAAGWHFADGVGLAAQSLDAYAPRAVRKAAETHRAPILDWVFEYWALVHGDREAVAAIRQRHAVNDPLSSISAYDEAVLKAPAELTRTTAALPPGLGRLLGAAPRPATASTTAATMPPETPPAWQPGGLARRAVNAALWLDRRGWFPAQAAPRRLRATLTIDECLRDARAVAECRAMLAAPSPPAVLDAALLRFLLREPDDTAVRLAIAAFPHASPRARLAAALALGAWRRTQPPPATLAPGDTLCGASLGSRLCRAWLRAWVHAELPAPASIPTLGPLHSLITAGNAGDRAAFRQFFGLPVQDNAGSDPGHVHESSALRFTLAAVPDDALATYLQRHPYLHAATVPPRALARRYGLTWLLPGSGVAHALAPRQPLLP